MLPDMCVCVLLVLCNTCRWNLSRLIVVRHGTLSDIVSDEVMSFVITHSLLIMVDCSMPRYSAYTRRAMVDCYLRYCLFGEVTGFPDLIRNKHRFTVVTCYVVISSEME